MQSKDLRIGNLIEVRNHVFRVTALHEYDLDIEDLSGEFQETHIEYTDIKLIKITTDFLISYGFLKMGDFFQLHVGSRKFSVSNDRGDNWEFMIENTYATDIHFIHQIQNLYFALTGEELQLKAESKP